MGSLVLPWGLVSAKLHSMPHSVPATMPLQYASDARVLALLAEVWIYSRLSAVGRFRQDLEGEEDQTENY